MELPKMKILIYVLTFLGYAWTGYGSGILGNLRDAVLAAEQVFGDVLQNVVKVARKIRDVHDVLDAAVQENCQFTCPSGATPVKNKFHKPQSNGCGSYGLELVEYLPSNEMTQCCNAHDICYDTCNLNKAHCDVEFQRCLYRVCENTSNQSDVLLKACKAKAKLLFSSTLTLGCKAYLDSQKNACFCAEDKRKRKFASGGEL